MYCFISFVSLTAAPSLSGSLLTESRMSINVLALSSKRIDSSSLLFSVKAKQKTEAYLRLARAECFNYEFPGDYGSPMLCYFTAALKLLVKLGHNHVKCFLRGRQCSGKSRQQLVLLEIMIHSPKLLVKKRDAPLIQVFSVL